MNGVAMVHFRCSVRCRSCTCGTCSKAMLQATPIPASPRSAPNTALYMAGLDAICNMGPGTDSACGVDARLAGMATVCSVGPRGAAVRKSMWSRSWSSWGGHVWCRSQSLSIGLVPCMPHAVSGFILRPMGSIRAGQQGCRGQTQHVRHIFGSLGLGKQGHEIVLPVTEQK